MISKDVLVEEGIIIYINNCMYILIKRLFDILFGLVGMILLIPLSIIIKIGYLFSGDTKSIFFVQKRIGKNGKLFNLYKYRTMVPNADEILDKLLKENSKLKKEYEKNKKLKDDPRITKFGMIVRKYSLDEFPQFINVFLGNMSLVGNRPYLPREKEDMGKYYDDIVKTKPGITGLWQVSGRNDISFKKRLKLEKEYSNKRSLFLDIKILFSTIKVVITGHGAM